MKVLIDNVEYVEKKELKGNSNTGNSNTGDSNTGNSNTGDSNTGDSNTGHWNSGDWNSGDRNTGDSNSGHWNSGDWNSGDRNTGDSNSGHSNTGHWNTGHSNTGHWNTGHSNTGDSNSGNSNTGHWNTGNRNTGNLNTKTPRLRLFNKKVKKSVDISQIYYPSWLFFKLTEWIYSSKLTESQKKEHPYHEQTGGALIVHDYKEAAQRSYNKATKEEQRSIEDLPNYDAYILFEIFGIDRRKCSHCPLS